MSEPSEKLWSYNPNAPRISPWLYNQEKEFFAASVIGGVLYGIIVILFFQCIGALINPANDMRTSVKLGLVAYTVALFSCTTISGGAGRDEFSTIFIETRNFPGIKSLPPGPIGGTIIYSANAAHAAILDFAGFVNQWLSDGLLLYRCHVIYGMNYWATALPSFLYVASIGTGIVSVYFNSVLDATSISLNIKYINPSYYAICLTLNLLLTSMIITKLILHRKNLQHAIGTSNATTRVYAVIVIMLIESYALYAIALLAYVVTWALRSVGLYINARIFNNIQVIVPYLIVLRVANRRALTSEMISGSNNIGSIQFRSQGTTDGNESLPDSDPTSSMQAGGQAPEAVGERPESSIEEVPL